MRSFNPCALLLFALVGAHLREIQPDTPFGSVRPRFGAAEFLLTQISNDTGIESEYPNAHKAAGELAIWLRAIKDDDRNDAWRVNAGFLDLLLDKGLLGKMDSALDIDISALPIYLLEEKRGYSIPTLLRNIEMALPAEDRELSEFAQQNMQEAGACLAFERYTGCAYHMSRAVEDVARCYYTLITGRPTEYNDSNGVVRHRMLGQIAEELQDVLNKYPRGQEPELLSLVVPTLRQFCRVYRHPLSHADPELKTLEPNDAEIAFGHAISAISTILEDVRVGGSHFSNFGTWFTL